VISSHRRLYQRGAEVGLYDDAFGERLAELWNQNRTKTYYRLGIATEAQAEAMHELATEMHRDLVDGSQLCHECLCGPQWPVSHIIGPGLVVTLPDIPAFRFIEWPHLILSAVIT